MQKKVKLVYSPNYDISFYGIEKLHPFDSCKYSHTWKVLSERLGDMLQEYHIPVNQSVSLIDIQRVHSSKYVSSLEHSRNIASALELPFLGFLPSSVLDRQILQPMRLATMGTIIAAEAAVNSKYDMVVNMSGGYHHASRNQGEGFCIYSDVYIAIESLRSSQLINRNDDKILYIDLDAHQGNGIERIAKGDDNICIFDMYNRDTYPQDAEAKKNIDYNIPLPSGTGDDVYLNELKYNLNLVLKDNFKVAFYNAGTDVFEGDSLGGLKLTSRGILKRDLFVIEKLAQKKIPCVMVLSGGYSAESYMLVANTLTSILVANSSAQVHNTTEREGPMNTENNEPQEEQNANENQRTGRPEAETDEVKDAYQRRRRAKKMGVVSDLATIAREVIDIYKETKRTD